MPFFDSLAAQLSEPLRLEALRRRIGAPAVDDGGPVASGAMPDQEARYGANVARRLGLPSSERLSVGDGAAMAPGVTAAVPDFSTGPIPSPGAAGGGVVEASPEKVRYSANVARRLAQIRQGDDPDDAAVRAQVKEALQPAPDLSDEELAARAKEALGYSPPPVARKRLSMEEVAAMAPGVSVPRPDPDFSTSPIPSPDPEWVAQQLQRRLGQYGVRIESPPAVPQAGHGFLAHLKGAVEGLGAGLATGHPVGGAIMGVAGGVNPQLGANAWYNDVTLPRWEQQTASQMGLAGQGLGMLAKLAEITGRDLVTGEPTAAQEKQDALEGYRNAVNGLKASHDEIIKALGEGRLSQLQANLLLHQQMEAFNEQIRTLQTQIQQQNADTRAAGQRATAQYQQGRLHNAEQPRTSRTTKIWGRNPDHGDWEKTRDALLKQYPGTPVNDLIKSGLLGKEPPRRIQTGSATTRGSGEGSGVRGQGNRIPAQKQAVPASRLREMLTHPGVKARGIKDVNALRKDLADQGYTIDETK